MPLIGIISNKRDFQTIKREISNRDIEVIAITEESIENLKNIKFSEIIFLTDIKLKKETYTFMSEILSNVKYLIINDDVEIKSLQEINIEKPIKVITFGFNQKATITISSIKEDKIIVCLQRNIEKLDKEIIETQEKEIRIDNKKCKKTYINLIVFIIEQMHNL